MTDPTVLYERRRYSAVALQHPALGSVAKLKALLGKRAARPKTIGLERGAGSALRIEYRADRNFYPEHIAPSKERSGGAFAHYVYMLEARGNVDGNEGRYVLVASPYVRLLNLLLREIDTSLGRPAPRYVAPKLRPLFRHMAQYQSGFRATRVTVQLAGEVGLELVSLTGRSPLRSDLHAQIRKVADPYSLRVEVEAKSGNTNVHADRHGNFWFYLANEKRIGNVSKYLAHLNNAALLRSVASMPLRRESADE